MSLCYNYCLNQNYGDHCDLNGPREYMCEACLTHLVRSERPASWSPRVRPEVPTDAHKGGLKVGDMMVRFRDCAPFTVVDVGHWSLITSDDLNHEEYRVKWMGDSNDGPQYVGVKGEIFVLFRDK